jgi:ankyrin repeat protein
LYIAVEKGHLSIAKALIAKGSDVHSWNMEEGTSALYVTVENGDLPMVETLLAAGADVNCASSHYSPLYAAVDDGNQAMVECLLNSSRHRS